MIGAGLIVARTEELGCLVEINDTPERFGAHLHLDGDPRLAPGDRVRITGGPIDPVPGLSLRLRRRAVIERAGPLRRAWTRLRARFELAELYEVSFSDRRLP